MSRRALYFTLLLNLILVVYIIGALIYIRKHAPKVTVTQKTVQPDLRVPTSQINPHDYPFKDFSYAIQKDEYKGGYFLTGLIDGKIIREQVLIPETKLTSVIASKLYFINKNLDYVSLILPIVAKDEKNNLIVIDLAAAKGFEQEGITQEAEILDFFIKKLENKEGKVLSVGIREAKETSATDDPLSEHWNNYFKLNETSYKSLIESGNQSINVLFIRSITSSLFKDSFVNVPESVFN